MKNQFTIKSQLTTFGHFMGLVVGLAGIYVFSNHGNLGILIASLFFVIFGCESTVSRFQINDNIIFYSKAKFFGLLKYNKTTLNVNEITLVKFSKHQLTDTIDFIIGDKKYSVWTALSKNQLQSLINAIKTVSPELEIIK